MVTSYGAGYSPSAPTERQLVAAGRRYRPASAIGCLIFHGSGDTALSPYKIPYGTGIIGTGLIEALARRGIPSMSADWARPNPWGNDTVIARAADGFTFLTSAAADFAQSAPDQVFVACFSEGATNGLNWVTRNLSKVKAIVLGIPGTDMQHLHDDGVAAASMEAAYGGLAAWQAALPTHSPINFAGNLSGIPAAAWYGKPDTDNVIRPADVEAFAAAHGNCELHSLGAAGHNPNLIPADEMADFLGAHL